MIKLYQIPTPENIHLEYELAGLGSRFIAFFVDTLIQYTLLIVAYGVIIAAELGSLNAINGLEDLNSYIIAIGLILTFIILYGYFIFFEMILSGQSPGKKLAKIRVIKQTGEAVGFLDSFIRNILRLADFLPVFNLVGICFIVFNKDYKRLGDLAAHTIVVKVQASDIVAAPVVHVQQSAVENELILRPVTSEELQLLKDVLERRSSMDDNAYTITKKLKDYFKVKFQVEEHTFKNDTVFLEEIYRQNVDEI